MSRTTVQDIDISAHLTQLPAHRRLRFTAVEVEKSVPLRRHISGPKQTPVYRLLSKSKDLAAKRTAKLAACCSAKFHMAFKLYVKVQERLYFWLNEWKYKDVGCHHWLFRCLSKGDDLPSPVDGFHSCTPGHTPQQQGIWNEFLRWVQDLHDCRILCYTSVSRKLHSAATNVPASHLFSFLWCKAPQTCRLLNISMPGEMYLHDFTGCV